MQNTKSRNGGRKTRGKTPDLMGTLKKPKRGPGRPPKPAPTADQIADSLEAHANQLLVIAKDLRS